MDLIIDGRRSKMLEDERRVNLIEIYSNNIAWQHKIIFSQWDFAELLIDGNASIVQWGRLEDYAQRAAYARQRENPQEETIQNHWDELPVLDDLQANKEDGDG